MTIPSGAITHLNERYVRAFVSRGSGLSPTLVIRAQRNSPVPEQPFATVVLISDLADGEIMAHGVEDAVSQWQYKTATYSVQFFRDGASERAARLCLWSESDDGLLAQEGALRDSRTPPGWPNGTRMRLSSRLSWTRIDALHDDDWEERALVEMPCRYVAYYQAADVSPDRVSINFDGIQSTISRR